MRSYTDVSEDGEAESAVGNDGCILRMQVCG